MDDHMLSDLLKAAGASNGELNVQMSAEKEPEPERLKTHHYSFATVLRPRGPMKEQSLGLLILEALQVEYEHFTSPDFADNPDEKRLALALQTNLFDEVRRAWTEFKKNNNPAGKNV